MTARNRKGAIRDIGNRVAQRPGWILDAALKLLAVLPTSGGRLRLAPAARVAGLTLDEAAAAASWLRRARFARCAREHRGVGADRVSLLPAGRDAVFALFDDPAAPPPSFRPVGPIADRIVALLAERGRMSFGSLIAELSTAMTLDVRMACYDLARAGRIAPPPLRKDRGRYERNTVLELAPDPLPVIGEAGK